MGFFVCTFYFYLNFGGLLFLNLLCFIPHCNFVFVRFFTRGCDSAYPFKRRPCALLFGLEGSLLFLGQIDFKLDFLFFVDNNKSIFDTCDKSLLKLVVSPVNLES